MAAFKSDQPGAIGPARQRLSIRGETARQGLARFITQRPVAERGEAHKRQPIQQQPRFGPMAAITDQGQRQIRRQMRPGKPTTAQCRRINHQSAKRAQSAGNIGQRKGLRRILCLGRCGANRAKRGEESAARNTWFQRHIAMLRQATIAERSAALRCQASAASSSKSSASFFIMVPPNSSASTIVTARR